LSDQPKISEARRAIVALIGELSIITATNILSCFTAGFHDVEPITDNHFINQLNFLFGV
jgi:hypothetical protein